MRKNRQQRRHPTFPGFPLLQPAGEAPVQKKTGEPNSKEYKYKKIKNKNRTR